MVIAKTFQIDPVLVMDEPDIFKRATRVAAALLANQWEREATERAKRK